MRSSGISVSAAALALGALAAPSTHAADPTGRGGAGQLRRHRRSRLRGCLAHGQGPAGRPSTPCSPQPSEATQRGGQGGLAGRARALSADRGLPLRQRDRRRLGRQGQRLAARRRSDRLRGGVLRQRIRREPLLRRERRRPSQAHRERRDDRRLDHRCGAAPLAARDRRDRGECRDRLPCGRIPALGAGPERHRTGRRRAAVDRLPRPTRAPAATASGGAPI